MNLIEQLRESARLSAEATQLLAGAKSKRNAANGDVGAQYKGGTPEQMVEWKAADEIWCLREIVREVRIMANAGAFKQYEGEPWLLRVRNIDLNS